MKLLIVGDLHLKRSNLKDSKPLIQKILKLARDHDGLVFLGDLYNDHGIITSDVQTFVCEFFHDIEEVLNEEKRLKVVVNLEGNHDQDGDGVHSSLFAHKLGLNRVKNVITPTTLLMPDGSRMGFIPYIRDPRKFEQVAQSFCIKKTPKVDVIFCHQEFNGAQFENGMYAPNGADMSLFPNIKFISGHIHKMQEFANVWYPGAPRWLTKSDANDDRGVWSVDFDTNQREFISSSDVSPRFFRLTVKEGEPDSLPLIDKKDVVYVDYFGNNPKTLRKIQNKYEKVSIKCTPPSDVISRVVVSETKGIIASINDYVSNLELSVPKEELIKEISTRMSV